MEEQSSIQFTENKAVITLFIDTSKTFLKLSTGALALTITLREKIIGDKPGTQVSKLMLWSWAFYLFAIGSSALYQYCAVKYVDSFSRVPGATVIPERLKGNPGYIYGAMLVFFLLGSLFLIGAAWCSIP